MFKIFTLNNSYNSKELITLCFFIALGLASLFPSSIAASKDIAFASFIPFIFIKSLHVIVFKS